MPSFAYAEQGVFNSMKDEIRNLKLALDNVEPLTDKLEEPENINKILFWLEEAIESKKNILMYLRWRFVERTTIHST